LSGIPFTTPGSGRAWVRQSCYFYDYFNPYSKIALTVLE
jgi:hypothetical protein